MHNSISRSLITLLSVAVMAGCGSGKTADGQAASQKSGSTTAKTNSAAKTAKTQKTAPLVFAKPQKPEPRPDDVLAGPLKMLLETAAKSGDAWTSEGPQLDLAMFVSQLTDTLAKSGQQPSVKVPMKLDGPIAAKGNDAAVVGCFIDQGDVDTQYPKNTLYIIGGNAKLQHADNCVVIAQGNVEIRYGKNCVVICGGELTCSYFESSLFVSRRAMTASYPTNCVLASTAGTTAIYVTNSSVINKQPADRVSGTNARAVPLDAFHFVLP